MVPALLTSPFPSPETAAITDTKVLLDIYSCHDLTTTYNEAYGRLRTAALDDLAVVYRRARARESLLLAMHYNKVKATTYSLHSEVLDLLLKRASPAPGGETMESDFTTVFLHFIKDYLLPNWNPTMPAEPGNEAKDDADSAYVAVARESGLPLLTNEGYGQSGIMNEKMRKLAKDAGVAVFAPREFYPDKIDEAAEIEDFLRRFKERAPVYMEARRKELGEDKIGGVLTWIYGYYRMILRGEVEGTTVPVRLSVI
jgi:hypothetical protein